MSLRWRKNGKLLCAAKTEEEDGDTYIDDRLHHQLNSISRAIIADVDEAANGRWHWVHSEDGILRARDEMEVLSEEE